MKYDVLKKPLLLFSLCPLVLRVCVAEGVESSNKGRYSKKAARTIVDAARTGEDDSLRGHEFMGTVGSIVAPQYQEIKPPRARAS